MVMTCHGSKNHLQQIQGNMVNIPFINQCFSFPPFPSPFFFDIWSSSTWGIHPECLWLIHGPFSQRSLCSEIPGVYIRVPFFQVVDEFINNKSTSTSSRRQSTPLAIWSYISKSLKDTNPMLWVNGHLVVAGILALRSTLVSWNPLGPRMRHPRKLTWNRQTCRFRIEDDLPFHKMLLFSFHPIFFLRIICTKLGGKQSIRIQPSTIIPPKVPMDNHPAPVRNYHTF